MSDQSALIFFGNASGFLQYSSIPSLYSGRCDLQLRQRN